MVDFRVPILVIDDDFSSGDGLGDWLRKIGFVNIVQDDGSRAQLLLGARSFGLVLSKEDTARCSGLELLRMMRRAPELARMRFIMIKAIADAAHIRVATESGVEAFVAKPFTIDRLRHLVFGLLIRAASTAANDGGAASAVDDGAHTAQTLLPDHRPMMPVYENALELRWRYGQLKPQPGSDIAPWQVALKDWWQFMRCRQVLTSERRRAAGAGDAGRSS